MKLSKTLRHLSLYTTLFFFTFALLAVFYAKESGHVLEGLLTIFTSPSPLVTDYFAMAPLPSVFINAGLCSAACMILIYHPLSKIDTAAYAGYYLVIAHCFYGANLINMMPCAVAALIALFIRKKKITENLSIIFFTTAFGPFAGELIYRYPFPNTLIKLIAIPLFLMIMAFMIPAMIDGARKWHRGYNLYNGGIALGVLAMFFYAFFYKTMGISSNPAQIFENPFYEAHNRSYFLFINIFFICYFVFSLIYGWWLNNHSFEGYKEILMDDSYGENYDGKPILINMAVYGLVVLCYLDLVILLCDGVGFTGATTGALIASLTFTASGQQARNILPIFGGYVLVYAFAYVLTGGQMGWSLSTQGYINGVAFATGLCPIAGVFGPWAGIIAGALDAILCTSTSALHGGLMLYNGGLTSGLTAMVMLPALDFYRRSMHK